MSKVYTKEPGTIRFDDSYVEFNPLHNKAQYEATKMSISKLGQQEPILMLDGLCIDGRHRVRIAEELGIMVRCTDIPSGTPKEDIIAKCNINVMSGRDYDNAQKAIQALKLVNEYNMSAVQAAKSMKVDRRLVSFASTIKGLGREDILAALLKGNKVHLPGMIRPSKSLEVLCKYVKTESEADTIEVDDSERVRFDPDAKIKTEQGKAWFYELVNYEGIREDQLMTRLALVELANLKFRLREAE